jgi:hypothetical protein
MTAHVFNDPADYTEGGTWLGDYGRHVCRWTWDAAKQELTVICGPHGKRIELGAMPPSHEPLEKVLPRIALEAARRIAREQAGS